MVIYYSVECIFTLAWPNWSLTLAICTDSCSFLWNHISRGDDSVSPLVFFSGSSFPSKSHLMYGVVQSLFWILNPRCHKLPRWIPSACLGRFLGSKDYITSIGLVRHLSTGFISPLFHLVEDDHFSTVHFVKFFSLEWFDAKSWEANVLTGLEKYLDCDAGPTPALHRLSGCKDKSCSCKTTRRTSRWIYQ